MNKLAAASIFAIVVCSFHLPIFAQSSLEAKTAVPAYEDSKHSSFERSAELDEALNSAVDRTVAHFGARNGLKKDNLAVTLIDLRDAQRPVRADVRGEEKIYPASVVKMFYMAAVFRWIEEGKLKMTPEIRRALKDMIAASSNDATHFIVDVLTDAPGGGELSESALKEFGDKRNAVNRYFTSLGYENINVNQKTYCEDLYGRERQFWNAGKNRNMLTTNATARLLAEIALGRSVSAESSAKMMELMKREPFSDSRERDGQATAYTGKALIDLELSGSRLWSKAGWTSKARHDAAYVETADGLKFVLVVFTENFAAEKDIIPMITAEILNSLGERSKNETNR